MIAPIEKIPIKYTGPVSMNARTINNSIYSIKGQGANGESLKGKPLHLGELMNVLNFLESNIMSNKIHFDGTVPKLLREQVLTNVADIKKLNINSILPIEASSRKNLKDMCRGAAEQSSELFKSIDVNSLIANKTDFPVKNFQNFERDILNSSKNKKDGDEICKEIIDKVFSSEKSYTGSKCVVGIILANIEGKELLDIIAEYFKLCKNDEQKSYLVGALINRFRTNYINKLSSQDDYEAAYQIDSSLEGLQSQQTFLLWSYILRRIERSYNSQQTAVIQKLFSNEHNTFPIGFAAILHPASNSVESLFENAMQLHDDHFVKLLAKNTEQQRYIHQFDTEEFKNFQDELLSKTFLKLGSSSSRVCDIVINHLPEIIGISSGLALGSFIQDHNSLFANLSSQITSSILIREITAKGLQMILPNRKYNVFVNNMEKFSTFYKNAFEANDDVSKRLASQIEKIFNRKLVLT